MASSSRPSPPQSNSAVRTKRTNPIIYLSNVPHREGGRKGWCVMLKKGILSVCCALLIAGASQASITMTGTGKVKYVPDVAHLSFGVSHEAKTAAEAWKKN